LRESRSAISAGFIFGTTILYIAHSLAAFAPNEGQSLTDFIYTAKLSKGFLVFDSGGFIYNNPEMFPQAFAQDVDPAQAKVMAATQKPTNQSILAEKSAHQLGSNYLLGIKSLITTI
jgi:hypothetical protein